MLLIGQIPGADEAIAAASRSGWEAVLLVVVMLAVCSAFWLVMNKNMNEAKTREDRLAARVTQLEDVIRTELLGALKMNSETMGKVLQASDSIVRAADRMTQTLEKFTSILDVRPCLLPVAEQRRLLKEFEDVEK